MTSESLVTIGKVLREWALKGELMVLPLTFDPGRFLKLETVAVETPNSQVDWKRIRSAKIQGDRLLISIEGCETPDEAKKYRGALLKIDASESPELPEGVYYHHQITGLKVYTVEGEYLGEITGIMDSGPNDIYVVEGGKQEYLLLAIKEVVRQIDLKTGRMVVKLMEEV